MSEIVAYLANAFLYAALAVYFWRTRWVAAGPRSLQPIAPRAVEHYAVLVPLALHGLLVGRALFAPDGLHLNVGTALSAILWLTVLIYWLGNFYYRLDGLQALVLPLAAAATLAEKSASSRSTMLPTIAGRPNCASGPERR